MNYIKQLNAVFQVFYFDQRLNNSHIGLYMALFFYWNLHHFANSFYANRKELMALSKIGSRSTYHRLILDLHTWGYIRYFPSKSPNQKTMVEMIDFRTTSGTVLGQTSTLMERYRPKNVPATLYSKQKQTPKRVETTNPKNENEVVVFFKEKGWPIIEASKFYNHYQGIGWKIAGKAPVVDWKATAQSWMLRADTLKTAHANSGVIPLDQYHDNLKTKNEKNYGQPL